MYKWKLKKVKKSIYYKGIGLKDFLSSVKIDFITVHFYLIALLNREFQQILHFTPELVRNWVLNAYLLAYLLNALSFIDFDVSCGVHNFEVDA